MKTQNHVRQILFLFILVLLTTTQSKADRRYFGRSYLTYTPLAKEVELEFWQTSRIGKSAGSFFSWQPQIEVEYGVTDRLVASVYMNFISEKSSNNNFSSTPLSFSAASLEFRYRLTNPEEYYIDPALYFELTYNKDAVEYEPKILLTKRFGKFISAVNIGGAFEKSINSSEMESEFEITAGVAYDLTNHFAFGLEFRNNRNFREFFEKEETQAVYLGPTLNYNTESVNVVLNFMAQINGSPATNGRLELLSHEKYEAKLLVGIEL